RSVHQTMDRATYMIDEVKLVRGVLTDVHDPELCISKFPVFGDLLPVVAHQPNLAGVVVAINISLLQLRQAPAVIHPTPDDRPEVGMGVLDDRFKNRSWPLGAIRAKRVATLVDAPAVVAALLDEVNAFPQILPNLSGPKVAGSPVKAESPSLAETVS